MDCSSDLLSLYIIICVAYKHVFNKITAVLTAVEAGLVSRATDPYIIEPILFVASYDQFLLYYGNVLKKLHQFEGRTYEPS